LLPAQRYLITCIVHLNWNNIQSSVRDRWQADNSRFVAHFQHLQRQDAITRVGMAVVTDLHKRPWFTKKIMDKDILDSTDSVLIIAAILDEISELENNSTFGDATMYMGILKHQNNDSNIKDKERISRRIIRRY
jgi:hypothetical protein